MEAKHTLVLYILAQGADSAPPLGTVLGNLGVNSINFCKDFNVATEDIPNFLTLRVRISVFSNKSYKFTIEGLPLSPLLALVAFEKNFWRRGKNIPLRCLKLKDVIQLVFFAFPGVPLRNAFPVVLGTIKAAHLQIV